MLKEIEVEEKGIQALKECFLLIPSLHLVSIEKNQSDSEPDLTVKIQTNSGEQLILVEVSSLGTPKSVRNAINKLKNRTDVDPRVYGIVIAPYISPRSADICEKASIGYLDLSGNCKIAFKDVYISQGNFPNQYPFRIGLSSIYSPKSERILRVLLTYPFKQWKTLELSKESQVSPGMISHVRKKLNDEEWIETTPKGFQLIQPSYLLDDWSKNYSFQKHTVFNYYSLKPLSEVEEEIAKLCDSSDIHYALTSFSASSRLAPMVRNQRTMIYVDEPVERLAVKLNLKPVDSGANITLINPYDQGVFWNAKKIDGINIATPVQVYLDLINHRGRGEEAAEFLFREVIQTSWQHQKSIITESR